MNKVDTCPTGAQEPTKDTLNVNLNPLRDIYDSYKRYLPINTFILITRILEKSYCLLSKIFAV